MINRRKGSRIIGGSLKEVRIGRVSVRRKIRVRIRRRSNKNDNNRKNKDTGGIGMVRIILRRKIIEEYLH